MGRISDGAYNKARDILIAAGSETAKKSHVKHGNKDGSPEDHGKKLLAEARDELYVKAKKAHPTDSAKEKALCDKAREATRKAAKEMGVTSW